MRKKSKLAMLLLFVFAAPLAFAAEEAKKPEAPAAQEQYKPTSKKLNRADFDALLAKPEGVLVIDLRRPDEVSTIGGFPVYLSVQADQLENSLALIPKERAIVTVSNHSGRSGKSADVLASKGFNVAGYLGAQYYEQEGGKLTKIAIPAPKPKAEEKK
ncbi:MAG: rhodanese-like domain-containing protein [Methylococcaceae bacterium]|nr:rhodanese-like domain-containing protein [Methylococcaceae bacterium]